MWQKQNKSYQNFDLSLNCSNNQKVYFNQTNVWLKPMFGWKYTHKLDELNVKIFGSKT